MKKITFSIVVNKKHLIWRCHIRRTEDTRLSQQQQQQQNQQQQNNINTLFLVSEKLFILTNLFRFRVSHKLRLDIAYIFLFSWITAHFWQAFKECVSVSRRDTLKTFFVLTYSVLILTLLVHWKPLLFLYFKIIYTLMSNTTHKTGRLNFNILTKT